MIQNFCEKESQNRGLESLHLCPTEQLQKKAERSKRPPIIIKSKRFEILLPHQKETLEEMIYSLIDAGITQAKLYLIKATNEAMNQLAEKQPILRDMIWSKIQSFLAMFQHQPEVGPLSKIMSIEDDDDYVVIKKLEEEKQPELEESSSEHLSKSSFVRFDSTKLKSINLLKRFDGVPEEPMTISFLAVPNDKSYNNSFKLSVTSSEGSIVYAPEISSLDLRVINCDATEFYLVENYVYVQDVEELVQATYN